MILKRTTKINQNRLINSKNYKTNNQNRNNKNHNYRNKTIISLLAPLNKTLTTFNSLQISTKTWIQISLQILLKLIRQTLITNLLNHLHAKISKFKLPWITWIILWLMYAWCALINHLIQSTCHVDMEVKDENAIMYLMKNYCFILGLCYECGIDILKKTAECYLCRNVISHFSSFSWEPKSAELIWFYSNSLLFVLLGYQRSLLSGLEIKGRKEFQSSSCDSTRRWFIHASWFKS